MTQDSTKQGGSFKLGADFIQNMQIAFQLFLDPRVSLASKVLVPALALGYFLFPIDLLPDVVPFLGQIDDVAVLLILLRLFVMLAPQAVVAEYKGAKGQKASSTAGTATGAASSAGQGQKSSGQAGHSAGDTVLDAEYRVVDDA